VLVALSLDFDDGIPAASVEAGVAELERRLEAEFPEIARVFVEAKGFEDHIGASPGEFPPRSTGARSHLLHHRSASAPF